MHSPAIVRCSMCLKKKKIKAFNCEFEKLSSIPAPSAFPRFYSFTRRRWRKRPSLISRYPHETSAQETNWISLPRHANDRIPFPRLEVVGAMHLLARSSGGRSWRHSSENRITAAVERVPFSRMLSK